MSEEGLNPFQFELDQLVKENDTLKVRLGKLEGAIKNPEQRCPNCPDQGWYATANENTGDAEQEQCQWCYETPNSLFNVLNSLDEKSLRPESGGK